jgi:hypothetical protein
VNKLLFIIIAISFSSCARIINNGLTKFRFHAPPGSVVTYPNLSGYADSSIVDSNGTVEIAAIRSRSRLPVTIKKDTIDTAISIRPVFTGNWYANIFSYGIGFLVDIGTIKKYGYPANVYYNPAARRGYSALKPFIVPRSQLTILPMYLMLCKIEFGNVATRGIGTVFGLGYNYYTSPKTFYALEAAVVGDPLTIAERFYSDSIAPPPTLRKNGWSVTVRRHNVGRKFDIGYGPSAGNRYWTRYYSSFPGTSYMNGALDTWAKAFTLGCSFAASFRITSSFYAGINYQPHFIEIGDKMTWKYGHIISSGLYWRIRLRPYFRAG